MDLKEIKQIIDLMTRADLSGFEIEREGLKLRINRENNVVTYAAPTPGRTDAVPTTPSVSEPPPPAKEDTNSIIIKSPMVGTFYASSSPESPPFVSVGTSVRPDSVVCIIEAMKVMNEIQAELNGTITEILVQNGKNVEYGQPLFKLSPA